MRINFRGISLYEMLQGDLSPGMNEFYIFVLDDSLRMLGTSCKHNCWELFIDSDLLPTCESPHIQIVNELNYLK